MKSTTGIALFTNAKGTFSGPLTQFDCKGTTFFSDTQTFCNFMQKKCHKYHPSTVLNDTTSVAAACGQIPWADRRLSWLFNVLHQAHRNSPIMWCGSIDRCAFRIDIKTP